MNKEQSKMDMEKEKIVKYIETFDSTYIKKNLSDYSYTELVILKVSLEVKSNGTNMKI